MEQNNYYENGGMLSPGPTPGGMPHSPSQNSGEGGISHSPSMNNQGENIPRSPSKSPGFNPSEQQNLEIQKSAAIYIPDNLNLYETLPKSRENSDDKGRRISSVPKPRGDFKCRDVPFLILFIIFWIGMGIISIQTFLVAPYDTLRYGTNSASELCGTGNYTEYKYLSYFLSTEEMVQANPMPVKYKVCTNICSQDYLLYTGDLYVVDESTNETTSYISYLDLRNSSYHDNNLMVVNFTDKNLYEIYDMAMKISDYDNYLVPSVDVFNRCIPNLRRFGDKLSNIADQLQGGVSFASRVYQSTVKNVGVIIMEGGIALGLTFIWLILTYFFTGIFIWVMVITSMIALGGATCFSWYIYSQANVDAIRSSILDTKNPYVNKYLYNAKFFLVLSIVLSVIFVIALFFFLFAKKRINLGIKIIEEAGKAILKYPSLPVIPLIQFILITGLTIFFALIFIPVTITSRNDISTNTRKYISKHTPLKEEDISVKSYSLFIELYVVLGFYWTYYFIKAVGKTTICGTVATWYWAPTNAYGKKIYQKNAIIKTFLRICWYNLGSLAFGSLILGIISLLKYILAKVQKVAEKEKENKFVRWLIRCLRCCLECIDKVVKFITKKAYVEIAIYGYSFCTATYKASKIILRNAFRIIVIDKIGDIIFTLGKILVVSASVFLSFLILKNRNINDTYMLSIPLIISFILSLTIISVFMTVLNATIDTIFISVCEDCERNDGSNEKPYYMSKSIRKLVVKDDKNSEQNGTHEMPPNMY